jgi:tRNA (cmo5U34)-methyltransferase
MSGREWLDAQSAERWLTRRQELAPADQAHEMIVGHALPETVTRVLDLGTGDGALLATIHERWPTAAGIGLDISDALLGGARERFADSADLTFEPHDLMEPLPADLGRFDAVVSGLAVHHLPDPRKRGLFGEVFEVLEPGGVFCLFDVVVSPTPELHTRAQEALGFGPEDQHPSDQPAALEDQLTWLRDAGFAHVDCHWKWLELAVLAGTRTL